MALGTASREQAEAEAGRLVRTGRRVLLRLASHGPWTRLLTDAVTTLRGLPAPN